VEEPIRPDRRPRAVRRQLTLLALALSLVAGCQQPGGSSAPPTGAVPTVGPSPSIAPTAAPTTAGGIDVLIADLGSAGATVTKGTTFSSAPVGGEGTTVCVGTEVIRVYEFIDHEAALAASATIDRDDPSIIDNGVVSWTGRPRFWLRDRVLVLYLGADAPTDEALRTLLGPPFAEAEEGFMPLPDPACQAQ
jgi:hypothetical protein